MRWQRTALFVVVLIIFLTLPIFHPVLRYQFTLVIALALSALAVALLLHAGLLSFGHGLFYAAGAYAVAFIAPLSGVGAVALILIGGVVAGLAALVVGLFVVRYRGIFFAMLNLALSMVAYTALLKLYNVTGGSDGMSVALSSLLGAHMSPSNFGLAFFYVSVFVAMTAAWLISVYLRSPLGWGLEAIQHSELRVEYLGLSARNILLLAYVVSGVLAGFGGAITAITVSHVVPDLSYWTTSAAFIVVAVLGGIGSVLGSFTGALLYQLLSVNAAQYLTYTWELLLGLVVLTIIRFAPSGLWGLYDGWWKARRSRS